MIRQSNKDVTGEVDELLRAVGLAHGQRKTLAGSWHNGERRARRPPASQGALMKPATTRQVQLIRSPDWLKYSWLRHGFSTRASGVTTIYGLHADVGSLNLGWTKQDDDANVAENRRRFMAEITGSSNRTALITLRQQHSGIIRNVETWDHPMEGRLQTVDGHAVLRGDGVMTNLPGVLLGIQTADCVPVLVVDVRRHVVAAFHAGWRGTLARIVERGIGSIRLRYGSRPQDLLAMVGPSIGPCCYAVGEEVRFEFESQFVYAPQLFSEVYDSDPVRDKYPLLFLTARAPGHSNIGPQMHLNLWEANRRQLLDAGIPANRITIVGECSACAGLGTATGRKYFSHRADSGFTGRMLAVIGVI